MLFDVPEVVVRFDRGIKNGLQASFRVILVVGRAAVGVGCIRDLMCESLGGIGGGDPGFGVAAGFCMGRKAFARDFLVAGKPLGGLAIAFEAAQLDRLNPVVLVKAPASLVLPGCDQVFVVIL